MATAWQKMDYMCKIISGKDLITGSIARRASHWYLIYSEADFEVFPPRRGDTLSDGA